MSVIIKPYSDTYHEHVIQLIYKIQAEFNLPVSIDNQPDLQQIPQCYQTGNGNFWLALVSDQVVGTVALMDIGKHQAVLGKMFVDKDHRGNEKQIAKSLLEALFDWCKQKNIYEVYLGTQSIFLAAHRFYEKNGFVELSKTALPTAFPINPIDSKFYIIRL